MPDAWLTATTIADAEDPRARTIGASLAEQAGEDPLARAAALRTWLADLGPPSTNRASQSASDVLASGGRANCTGSANLATALGRALGIPTRHVAGVLTDDRLITHSIVELSVGTRRAWLRVEPQNGEVVGDDYMIALRIVTLADEGSTALDPTRWGAPGVPMRALVEALRGGERLTERSETERFAGCPRCDNAATRIATLTDTSPVRMTTLLRRSVAAWARDRETALTSSAMDSIARTQSDARVIATLDELERFVAAVE